MTDFARLKEGQKWMWALGDYGAVARHLERHAEALAAAAAIQPGMSVLDVAAGNGNFATAAARRGASVIATDLTPKMIQLGEARTTNEGLDVTWREGDAEALPFDDDRFDVVASVFGAMFAPRPEQVASELFRVVRSGGVVAMANYAHDGFLGAMSDLMARYSFGASQLAELPSPFTWGNEAVVRRRFDGRTSSLRLEHRTVSFEFPSLPVGVEFWERTNAPMMALKTRLPADRYRQLQLDVADLMRDMSRQENGGISLDSPYLSVVAHKTTQ